MRFKFSSDLPGNPPGSGLPFIPITLRNGTNSIDVSALVDSGASVGVLSYDIGLQLGLNWAEQKVKLNLGGNLARSAASAVLLEATIPRLQIILSQNNLPEIQWGCPRSLVVSFVPNRVPSINNLR